ncbi:MAG: helix-turn-helix domain-containing protein, partial [Anaerocolumna sp.]
MNSQKHLTLDARTTIELELCKGSSFKAIGQVLNK